ncbi:hypothetical protein VSS74_22930 [Conexibacter stalactiti]|uniref:Uncharacterized protein n=1 Tax=Conexibacter stalactiti TaxID=1940611 RepID=A0ABU4HV72_9ACTN|nr:hypothetical protein [Conexibacter stalactiti]MDW5597220.1 hypothetical protein [Conexibacter stalactiti]MEC5037862.1 hypothetical protein [Conexibacter stalactiti]
MSTASQLPTAAGVHPGLQSLASFPLVEALYGRRSRRFARGSEIPDGPLAYRSEQAPQPLDELETMLVLSAVAGTTGWHAGITHNARYAPHMANYAGGAAGRTFPSAAGFHTSELLFTDDSGLYLLRTRDAGALVDPGAEEVTPELMVARHRAQVRRIADRRLHLPAQEPFIEGHNHWCVNRPGSLLAFPVGDLAQHMLQVLCYLTQNGAVLYDDVNGRPIPGVERFASLVDPSAAYPLSYLEQRAMTQLAAEQAAGCYAGALMLQGIGLGGWMFDGIDHLTVLGASDDPDVPGLGFRADVDARWAVPNPTGADGLFSALCPPHVADMSEAVELLCERKFGAGGPHNAGTPGPWKDSPAARGSAQPHGADFRACVALQAQYVLDTFGRFPGTVPSLHITTYLQAHHLDLAFYDEKFGPGAYLRTHAEHEQRWDGR